jgi:uncharacterized protein YdhG (YjbR/CyaY superfamily)
MISKHYNNVDEYINDFPDAISGTLLQIRDIIRTNAVEATESISYGMPCYKLNGPLVYFGAMKTHLGFYPTPSGIETYKDKLTEWKYSKGAIQFPYNKPLPADLIGEIVRFRVKQQTIK